MNAFFATLVLSGSGGLSGLSLADPNSSMVLLANRVGGHLNAPIFLPTGEGAGAMDGIVAQLFLERGEGELTPLEPRTDFRFPFSTLPVAAYLAPKTVDIPGVRPGTEADLRLRVWESVRGCSYDEARTNGFYYGETKLTVKTGGGVTPPANLVGLHALILGGSESAHGKQEVRTFLVETNSSSVGTNWMPFAVLKSTNCEPVEIPAVSPNSLIPMPQRWLRVTPQ